jgi:hypothetical protein
LWPSPRAFRHAGTGWARFLSCGASRPSASKRATRQRSLPTSPRHCAEAATTNAQMSSPRWGFGIFHDRPPSGQNLSGWKSPDWCCQRSSPSQADNSVLCARLGRVIPCGIETHLPRPGRGRRSLPGSRRPRVRTRSLSKTMSSPAQTGPSLPPRRASC